MSIPKTIHFVWVGGNPKTEIVKRCMESWRRHLPDFEIVEWDNRKFFSEIDNRYAREAHAMKKWAFVSDYVRLHALHRHGGLYLDSDLEVTGRLDAFLGNRFFTGMEHFKGECWLVTALMAAEAGNPLIAELLSAYDDARFIREDGSLDLTTNTVRISRAISEKYGLAENPDPLSRIDLEPGHAIYPAFFFCAPEAGKPNFAIHHFSGSWVESFSRRNIFSLLGFSLVAMKRKDFHRHGLPIRGNERLLFMLRLSRRMHVAVMKMVERAKGIEPSS